MCLCVRVIESESVRAHVILISELLNFRHVAN